MRVAGDAAGMTRATIEKLRTLALLGTGGVAFAAANLAFARVFSVDQYALMTLLVALTTLGCALGPVGLDGIALREPRALPAPFVIAVAAIATLPLAVAASAAYDVPRSSSAALWAAAAALGALFVAAAHHRQAHRFGVAVALMQAPNFLLVAAAAACIGFGFRSAPVAFAILAVGLVVVTAIAFARKPARGRAPLPAGRVPWREALALGGASVATMVLVQLERVVLPHVLPLSALALMGVLATFAGSLFRILQMGVGFSLVPKLRAAVGVVERRRLIAHEALIAVAVVVAGSLAILAFAPFVERTVLEGKYDLSLELLIATLASGAAKICDGLVRSIGEALATARELASINAVGFAAVGIAVASAFFGARFGLAGLIYGGAVGWLFRAAATFILVAKHLRQPAPLPAATA